MDPEAFLRHVIRPTLRGLADEDLPWLASSAAERLLLGTALAESHLIWLVQRGGGPARGVYQMEPPTLRWLWHDYLPTRWPDLYTRADMLRSRSLGLDQEIVVNLAWATALARTRYLPVQDPLPHANDIAGMAVYWKEHYNTPAGAGTVGHFERAAGTTLRLLDAVPA